MRDIDFIPDVVAELAPQLPKIEKRFNEENEAVKKLLAQDHDSIGRVLKCHLIIENYINRHLESVSPSHSWQAASLRFGQKMELLPGVDFAWYQGDQHDSQSFWASNYSDCVTRRFEGVYISFGGRPKRKAIQKSD
jgi:hypothetical protein